MATHIFEREGRLAKITLTAMGLEERVLQNIHHRITQRIYLSRIWKFISISAAWLLLFSQKMH